MKGRDWFTPHEADRVRDLLREVRHSERGEQKQLREQIRAIGFYIDDWPRTGSGFTVSDFDDLVAKASYGSTSTEGNPTDYRYQPS